MMPPASRRVLGALAILVAASCGRGIEPYELHYESGERRAAGSVAVDSSGARRLHDRWHFWYPNGKLQCEGTFSHGGVLGATALLSSATVVPRAGRDGDWVTYSELGHLTSKGRYRAGQRHGPWMWFFDDGSPKSEGEYLLGEKHGRFVAWHANGKLAEDGAFERGLAVGRHRSWHANGQLASEGLFENGLETGMHERFAANGLALEEVVYVDGLRSGCRILWNESGVMVCSANYVKGRLEGEVKTYHPNGKVREIGLFVAGVPQGLHHGFDESGKKAWSQPFRGGKPAGDRIVHGRVAKDDLGERVVYAELLGSRADWSETGELRLGTASLGQVDGR